MPAWIAFLPLLAALAPQGGSAPADLEIRDLKRGSGRAVEKGDFVTVLYKGQLEDGRVFDSSEKKPPFVVQVGAGKVIPGWEQGLLGMKTGGKRRLVIPPALAYGDRDLGVIPPNSTLIFEIEVLRIERSSDDPKVETRILRKGEGKDVVTEGDTVGVHYRGTFLNGVPFDNSYDRDEPLAVEVGKTGLINGFTQGLIGMKLKEKRRIVIPSKLGYGENPRGPIPAHSTLVFELELVRLTKKVSE
jgi:peptidylprolyl isomerase